MRVAVLALQGDFAAHRSALEQRNVEAVELRRTADLTAVDGVVLPGGESTTMLRLLEEDALAERLTSAVREGLPVLATCAGLILLAREVRRPAQRSLGLLDVAVERNAYGRQVDSVVMPVTVEERAMAELGATELEAVFIRAPRVVEVGPQVAVLARRGKDPVLLRQTSIVAATFHPELSVSSPVIDAFIASLGGAR